ncbi:MAG: leucine-rich repeat domain-containing protein [Lachnospiraceae bacterium]|nr:leucine-rich repeat domain-containing protein [Lachnospiraceae bacterium]
MKQKKEEKMSFPVRCVLLCAVCAVLGTGCGAEEKEVREGVYADAPVLPVWELEEQGGDTEPQETEERITEAADIAAETEDMGSLNPSGESDGIESEAKADAEPKTPLLEQLFTYEIDSTYWWKETYLVITGIAEEYRNDFWVYMEEIRDEIRDSYGSELYMILPSDIDGMPVRKIADGAFAGVQMYGVIFPDTVESIGDGAFQNSGLYRIVFPENLESIGARAFMNCNLTRVAFPDKPLLIGEQAFAENKGLWTVLVPDVETEMEKDVFGDCASQFLLCYGTGQEEKRNTVLPYAEANGFDTMAVFASKEPVVNYHDEPLVLKPEVRNFFYGDDGDPDKDQWCTWEEDVNAPNFGYADWQWSGCSSWCGCLDFEQETIASSELASADGRYAAANVGWQNREAAWAEGVEGPGIGERIIYRQSYTSIVDNPWEEMTWENREPIQDGTYRYTEICIVNGYAKNQNTWEENGRIKRLAMYVEGQLYAYLELEDTMLPQYFLLPENDIIVLNRGMLEVCFEIEEVYPGTLYEDTCLTGLVMEFSGRYAH